VVGLTAEVIVAGGPGLGAVEVGVPADVGPGEVGVGQEAALAVEGRAVPVEALGEEDHDVRLRRPALPHVPVGHLAESQRRRCRPDAEGPPDGAEGPRLAHLGRVVLDAGGDATIRAATVMAAPPHVPTVASPEGDLLVLPLHPLDGVAPAPDVGLDLRPKLVGDAAAGAAHGPAGWGRGVSEEPPPNGDGWRTHDPTTTFGGPTTQPRWLEDQRPNLSRWRLEDP